MRLTRDHYRPRGGVTAVVRPKTVEAEIYLYETERRGRTVYGLTAFGGKRSKPDLHFIYKTPEEREKRVRDWLEGQAQHKALVENRRRARLKPHTLNVGDVLSGSWGYDQTNVEFWEVVELVGKTMVKIRELKHETERSSPPCDYVRPATGDDRFIENGKAKLRRVNGEYNAVNAHRCCTVTPWGGEAKYQTSLGWGH